MNNCYFDTSEKLCGIKTKVHSQQFVGICKNYNEQESRE